MDESTVKCKKSPFSSLSKTRYAKIMSLVLRLMPEKKEEFETEFCEIMCYDPAMNITTPTRSAATLAWMHKKAKENDTTTYETSGRKAAYTKNRGV